MSLIVVGIGDCKVSTDPSATLITYALGSCIGLLAHDPVARVAGMLHYMLPEASLNPERARGFPAVFGDTGIPFLVEAMMRKGADKNRLLLRAAGGSQVMDEKGVFNIGKRNQLTLKKMLWKAGLMLRGEETGGDLSRTVRMEVGTGRAFLRPGGGPEREWPLQLPAGGVR